MTDALFTVDATTRRIRGLVIPYGEMSRLNVSGTEPIMFSAGTVTLPADPAVVTLSDGHPSPDNLIPDARGRAVTLEETTAGIVAEFEIARTPEGDALLAAAQSEPRPRLSAEVRALVRRGARAVSSRLRGVALVPEGAFASSALFALGDIEEFDAPEPGDGTPAHVELTAESLPDDITVTTPEGNVTYVPAPTDPIEESEALMGNIRPGSGAPATPALSLDGLFAAIARNEPEQLRAYRGAGELFALSTVQHSGPTTLTIGADTQETGYLGELWTRAPYNRRIVPLVQHETLTNYKMQGWKWDEGKRPEMNDYAGNVAEVPSNAIDTVPVEVNAARLAGGHRLDRRYRDFNDQAVIGSYLTNQAEDYKRKTDAKCLAAIIAAGTVTAPGTVPAGIAKGLAAIVDGALGVIGTENAPAYALVDPALWRDILLTPKDDILAYLETGFGFEEGTGPGFTIRPAAVGAGKVFVGAREALTFYELGETPIRVEGVVPGNGAEDIAVFGYWATLANNAAAIRSVTVAA